MHDETSLRRLEEMGIDVYVPRESRAMEIAPSPAMADARMATPPLAAAAVKTAAASATDVANPARRDADVLLLADTAAANAESLLAAVARTLAFARVTCARANAGDVEALAAARALVAFGDAQSRAAGAALSAQRQSQIGWIVAADLPQLRGDALAKRALWGELKRVVRLLRPGEVARR